MTERRPHPTVSDVALALATRQRSERNTDVTVSNANAKSVWQVTVHVSDPDPDWVLRTAKNMTDFLVSEYPPTQPDNGEPTDDAKKAKELGNAARIHAARAKKATAQ